MVNCSGISYSKLFGVIAAWFLLGPSGYIQAQDSHASQYGSASNNLVSIIMTPVNQTLLNAATVQYKAIAVYENNAIRDVTDMATWAVNNSGMSGTCASITDTGLLTAGYCNGWGTTMSVSYGGITTTGFITSTYGNSTKVTVSPESTVMFAGDSLQFSATWEQLNNASGPRNYTDTVAWHSSNPAVASINSKGLATGLVPGKTSITATYRSEQFIPPAVVPNTNSPILLTIIPCDINKIEVVPAAITVLKGSVSQFKAKGTCKNGAITDITNSVNWNTDDAGTAMINSTGLAAGWKLGKTKATASLKDVTSSAVEINVADSTSLASIAIAPQGITISRNDKVQFKAVGTYQDGASQDITNLVHWATDVPDTVSVSTTGLATGLALGNAEITAVIGGLASPSALVKVSDTIVSIAVTPQSAQIEVLNTQQFKATAVYLNGETKDITDTVTWTTTAANIVNFNENGLAYGVAKGTATITASSGVISSEGVPITVISD